MDFIKLFGLQFGKYSVDGRSLEAGLLHNLRLGELLMLEDEIEDQLFVGLADVITAQRLPNQSYFPKERLSSIPRNHGSVQRFLLFTDTGSRATIHLLSFRK
jgi:hypothetical protein